MNERPADGHKVIVTRHALAKLDRQADGLRTELASLRRDIEGAQHESDETQSLHLQEANEHLLLAALHAETIAEAAVTNLDELARAAQRDVLTDTLNRAMMLDRLNNAIAMAQRHQSHIAVLFLDLDDFKSINDTLGHAVGDEVVQLVAQRLASAVRLSDTVSRHGGDEFLVLVAEISQASDAGLIATKILSALAEPAQIGEHVLQLSASIGISIFPEDGADAATLINRADAAMYLSKRRAHGGFQFHSQHVASAGATESAADTVHELAPSHDCATLAHHSRLHDLREANQRLVFAAINANEREAKANEACRQHVEFQAMIARELRSRLTPIRAAADRLNRVPTEEPLLGKVHAIIESQVLQMSALTDDLLDNSLASTEQLRLARRDVNIDDILAVLRDLVEAHGGTVLARSAGENCGSEFVVTLPLVESAP